jgi:ABC-type polysaccharide/polyol phosphate transport system ATPase subunit
MAEPSIRVQRVYKRFRRGENFDSLRDLAALWLRGRRRPAPAAEAEFWALYNISFDVAPGEAFGIIGPNGAGKSTMLKLLAGIMPADRGTIEVRGRVSALIELGAGFHGDLSGRENIYLNASILGMSRKEVRSKFDAIVEFAGIGDFLETPVKRYSSGMYARLGFAIAVHVEPAILLVDEVLSVGDRVFRDRCMEKMREFLKQGVSVVYVSHDLASVQRFCDRAMVISRGHESFCGRSAEAVGRYWTVSADTLLLRGPRGGQAVRVSGVRLLDEHGAERGEYEPGQAVRFEFEVEYDIDMPRPSFGLSLVRMEGHVSVFETSSSRLGFSAPPARVGDRQRVSYDFRLNLAPGLYAIGLHVRDRDALSYAAEEPYAAQVLVESTPVGGGHVHLAPRVRVQELPPEPGAPARAPAADAACLSTVSP